MELDSQKRLTEREYLMNKEAGSASVFTTGNGYMGVRGSFEEFASIRVQGAYIRGYIGEITEVFEPLIDNEYMKNYYFNEDKMKEFEKQESCINLPDFLMVRFFVGGKVFYPWHGKILSWTRTLDPYTGVLSRTVRWDDGEGRVTDFSFERFASYADKHSYVLKASARAVNHGEEIEIWSGIDTRAKTAGQFVTKEVSRETDGEKIFYEIRIDNSYGFWLQMGIRNKLYAGDMPLAGTACEGEGLIYHRAAAKGEISVEKSICVWTERDGSTEDGAKEFIGKRLDGFGGYDAELAAHREIYDRLFEKIDIKIEGDDESDGYLRYANYQTLITIDDDSVHSLSAKGLTGEKYNNFVWWDCEIYQLPFFVYTLPEKARQAILYRYRMLTQSKENAKQLGFGGAKYAFCSAVKGDERVWIYARHPFMQIHINSDIAYGILNYYRATGDEEFIKNYGMEMLCEIARYWIFRTTQRNGRYELLGVTGTDEHHLNVDNDAYTNYTVAFTLKKTLELHGRFACGKKYELTAEEIEKISDIAENIYLPMREDGLIAQFDGYFELSRSLQFTEGNTAKSFQMKQSGLYHLSQIIKQPDVMLLFNYIDTEEEFPAGCYRANWDYYEKMCETASSLSFPCHAMCALDTGMKLSFHNYFMQTLKIDINDLHNCSWQGLHSGCLAGGWLSVFYSVFGVRLRDDGVHFAPKQLSFWKSVTINFVYRGIEIKAKIGKESLTLEKTSDERLFVWIGKDKYEWKEKTISF